MYHLLHLAFYFRVAATVAKIWVVTVNLFYL